MKIAIIGATGKSGSMIRMLTLASASHLANNG